jgi:choline-sulfatase
MSSAQNLLIIMSDQHGRRFSGCYGHPLVRTPNLDALARRGTRFANTYCHSPVCVPSRASFATGDYIHKTGYWDNAQPYDGRVRSWGHHLLEKGHDVTAIGKLHYRSPEDSNGFSREIDTMHVYEGKGDLIGLLRSPPPVRGANDALARDAGRGESTYTRYDRTVAARARAWLEQVARFPQKNPWILLVSFVCPHFPLIAPEQFFDLYPPDQLPLPELYRRHEGTDHPVIQGIRRHLNEDDYFTEARVRVALAAYYGLVSFLDDNVGSLLRTLNETGLAQSTRTIYLSDHGESLGNRGIWGKSVLYDDAITVPLIAAGADFPEGEVVDTPISLLDLYPTILEAVGRKPSPAESRLPGTSLFTLVQDRPKERTVFSEYHAEGAITGIFMLRDARFKYVHYVGHDAQLFDLREDPQELRNLACEPAHCPIVEDFELRLRAIVNPELATACAFDSQTRLIVENGGEAAILARGDFGHSPVPGETPQLR